MAFAHGVAVSPMNGTATHSGAAIQSVMDLNCIWDSSIMTRAAACWQLKNRTAVACPQRLADKIDSGLLVEA